MKDRRGQTTSVDTANTHEEKNLSRKARAGKGFPRRAAEGLGVVIGCLAWMGRVGVGTLERWVRAGLGPWSQNLKIRTPASSATPEWALRAAGVRLGCLSAWEGSV